MPPLKSGGTVRHACLSLFWMGLAWVLWSGHADPLLIGLGALSCGVVIALVLRMDVVDHEGDSYRLGIRPLLYVPWLLWEIAKANLHVARVVLSPSLPISPRLIRVRASQASDLGQVIYANSITLTPGTISLDVRDKTILVHALTEASAQGLMNGAMDRRVTLLEGQEVTEP